MPEDTAGGIAETISGGIDLIQRVRQAIDIFQGTPVSVGNRDDIESCIRERTVGGDFAPRTACAIHNYQKTFAYRVGFSRLGIETDELSGEVALFWSADGCNLYDVFATEMHQPANSDWEVRLKPRIYPLQLKKAGECPCCREGGCCLLVHVEWEVERDVNFWPNPVMQYRRSGTICAADGRFQPLP